MQSLAEVERICYQNELDRAEAHMNAQDEEPSAEECFCNCIHSEACARVFGLVCRATITESLHDALECGECGEYEE